MRLTITTPLPVPYQVELFNHLAMSEAVELDVMYEFSEHPSRQWNPQALKHNHQFMDSSSFDAQVAMQSDYCVVSGYQRPAIRDILKRLSRASKPYAFWAERPGVRVPPWLGGIYRRLMASELHNRNVAIWGMGQRAIELYRHEFGANQRLFNIPYHSDLERFLELNREIRNQPRRILFSGSLIKRKGFDLLCRAFLEIARDIDDIELHVIGEGPLQQEMAKFLESVRNRVNFHGFQQWEALPRHYDRADILCAPSRYDGWGMIIPEALAAGLLVISTEQTGAATEMLSEDIGWCVEANNLDQLTQALRSALSVTPDDRHRRVTRGRKTVTNFGIEAGADKVISAVSQVLGG